MYINVYNKYVCIYIYIYLYVHIYRHTQTHTHTHTHQSTQINLPTFYSHFKVSFNSGEYHMYTLFLFNIFMLLAYYLLSNLFVLTLKMCEIRHWLSIAGLSAQSHCGDEEEGHIGLSS